jgi:hypothetical protein
VQLTLWPFGAEVVSVRIGPDTDEKDDPVDHEVAHYTIAGFRVDEAAHLPDRGIGAGEEDV